jgi:pyruvate,water dikinase
MDPKLKYRKENILWFNELKKEDIPFVGGKGANLGELYDKFPVPRGFCITVNAYQRFMVRTMIEAKVHGMLDRINVEDTEQLEKTSKKIRDLILKQKFPTELKQEIINNYEKLNNKKVAVRSSATAEDLPQASFAGQQDTYLDIEGNNNVIEAVQKCWASLFTARAIYYREEKKFRHRDVLICVVIQEMVDAEYAGVMFTVDPVNKKFILIEVVEGLGEKLVSGAVTPNTYFMNKKTHEIEQESGDMKFDRKILKNISKLGEKIEDHYKKPQDIEFAVDNKGKIFIVQSRPITTL